MRRILIYLISLSAIAIGIMWLLPKFINFLLPEYLTVIGFYFVFLGVLLVYFQIRINLHYSKRKAAMDFSLQNISHELHPLLWELKDFFKKDFFEFTKEKKLLEILEEEKLTPEEEIRLKKIVIKIFNFYERMAIGIYKEVFDEQICYDDDGFNLISFFKWTESYVDYKQRNVDRRAYVNFQQIAIKWTKMHEKENQRILKVDAKMKFESTIKGKSF